MKNRNEFIIDVLALKLQSRSLRYYERGKEPMTNTPCVYNSMKVTSKMELYDYRKIAEDIFNLCKEYPKTLNNCHTIHTLMGIIFGYEYEIIYRESAIVEQQGEISAEI